MIISYEKDKLIINKDKTLNVALSLLNKNSYKCLIVLDNKNKLIGTLTDGDIRRVLLNGAEFDDKLLKFINKKPFVLKHKKKQKLQISNKLKNQYKIIPVIDNYKVLKNIITPKDDVNFKNFFNKKSIKAKNIPTVIMAGGFGKRLLPHTNVIPKPLLPINGKSMIEHVIDTFTSYSLKNFYISINYKSNLIRTYLSDLKKKYKINFIQEKIPMGTAGSLSLIKNKIKKSFFLINCDSLTICDYISLFQFHEENNFLLTVVVSKKKNQIPYGVCKINQKGQLLNLHEKPETNFLANTGLYVINPKALLLIPKGKPLDMNELIEKLIKTKKKVGVFPIQESEWQDMSNWSLNLN